MGPFLLMDKSTFQGLSSDCVVYLMKYYEHRISPILLRELTSDLVKEKQGVDDAEMKKRVAQLAWKTQTSQSSVLPNGLMMVCNELLYGSTIPMDGFEAPREGAIEMNVPGIGRGIFFDEHPIMATLRNWAAGIFSNEDLYKAKAIRNEDSSVDLVSLYQEIEQETNEEAKVPQFKSLKELIGYADQVRFFFKTPRQEVLMVARYFFQDHTGHVGAVMRRWRRKGRPALLYFAPYAMYVHRVDIIYHYCLLRGFVKRSKKGKAHLDMQYLYYLPFCQIFSSDDKDLLQLVPFFLRPDQVLVSKVDLQQDLKMLSAYFMELSEEKRKIFYDEYGFYPPDFQSSFTADMWKRFMRPRRQQEGILGRVSPYNESEIMKELRAVQETIEKQRAQHYQKKHSEESNDPLLTSLPKAQATTEKDLFQKL